MSGRTVVVTGAAGFLGSHVVELLSAAGRFEVIATDVAGSPRSDALAALPGVRFQPADLRDTQALEDLVRAADGIVHLAAVRGKASDAHPRLGAYDVNVGATFDLVSLAARHRVRRFVYGSSHLVYGAFDDPHHAPFTEDQAAVGRGLTLYSAGKLAVGGADRGGLRRRRAGLPGAALRHDLRPPGEPRLQQRAPARAAGRDRPGEKAPIPWTRDTVHALTYVTDAALAAVRALEVEWDTRGAVNVVGPPVTAEELYSTLVARYGGDPDDLDWRGERSRYQLVSAERLRTVLGLETLTSLEDGLSAIIDWYRTELRAAPQTADAGPA